MLYGIDRIGQNLGIFSSLRLALICNATSISSEGESSVDILRSCTDLRLLLAPEHGVRGDRAAGEAFGGERDARTGLPIASLYSQSGQGLPEKELEDIDALVYDIQDVGMRCYTYISSLYQAMHYASEARKPLIVLDRPDPLGRKVEGMVLREDCGSFVGIYPLTSRYGLSCGEFATLVRMEEGLDLDLRVIRCSDYDPNLLFPDLGKHWNVPSPAIVRFENALLYSAFFLLEATNVSEGRGTVSPFAMVGAPFVRGGELAERMNRLHLDGVSFDPVCFTPTASKHAGLLCQGIMARVSDQYAFNGIRTGLSLLRVLGELYPDDFSYLPRGDGKGVKLDRLLGTRMDLELIAADKWAIMDADERRFSERARKAWLY